MSLYRGFSREDRRGDGLVVYSVRAKLVCFILGVAIAGVPLGNGASDITAPFDTICDDLVLPI